MMPEVNNMYVDTENSFIRDTLTKGLSKSARSLSSMVNSQVSVQDVEFSFSYDFDQDFVSHYTKMGLQVLMLKTELVGMVGGINYVLFTKEEAKSMCNATLGVGGDDNTIDFVIEFLKEVENVLAAGTITEIANRLSIEMYGDVPKIQAVSPTHILDIIHNETRTLTPKIYVKGTFNVPGLGVSPTIIWLFSQSFERVSVN